jgi:hypothetical protein
MLLNATVVAVAVVAVWTASAPVAGLSVYPLLLAAPLVALVWGIRAGAYARSRHRAGRLGELRQLWFAPVVAVLAAGLLAAGAPLQTRWALSRGSFDDAAAAVAAGRPVTGQVGLFEVVADRTETGGAVIFTEAGGALFDYGGFAFLPDGPGPVEETFEGPEFRSLGGGWYAWKATW